MTIWTVARAIEGAHHTSVDKNYITSEQFIHDGLLRKAEAAVGTIYKIWRRERKIDPIAFAWPAETIRTDSGEPHEGMVVLELPEGKERTIALNAFVERTKAYALLLIEQHQKEVVVIFESRNGARSWTIPIAPHGDVAILERALVQDNGLHVGLLWSPRMGVG